MRALSAVLTVAGAVIGLVNAFVSKKADQGKMQKTVAEEIARQLKNLK